MVDDDQEIAAVKFAPGNDQWFDLLVEEHGISLPDETVIISKVDLEKMRGQVLLRFKHLLATGKVDYQVVFNMNTFVNAARLIAQHHGVIMQAPEAQTADNVPRILVPDHVKRGG